MRHALLPLPVAVAVCLVLTSAEPAPPDAKTKTGKAEILWDKLGVPHIFAPSRESMFYAHGWAQMRGQADLLLQLYGESRARAAEYWGGESNRKLDRWLRINNVPELGQQWYAQQDPVFRRYMDAFARGINDYAKKHPDAISAKYRVVLPVSGVDVVQHSMRVVHFMYMGSEERMLREVQPAAGTRTRAAFTATAPDGEEPPIPGSNTWSIGPAHSATGNSMLVINPHLAWGNTFYRYMEIHVVGPGYDLYGAPQIGFPVAVVGFNPRAGWGRTVNTIDTVDFYRLRHAGQDGYHFDGRAVPWQHETKTLKILQPDGSMREEKLEVKRSVHGPVVYENGDTLIAMRVAGLDRPRMMEQWFRMGEATTLPAFKDALRMGAVPMWNANYADDQGHIMLVDNGLIPRRNNSEDFAWWSKPVPGDTSATLWKDYLKFDELPRSEDPSAGWNQNTNEPPWTATFPPLDRTKYPSWTAPTGETQPEMRVLRSLRMLSEKEKLTYEKLLDYKHSTRMELADRVLPDLLKAASPQSEAARVLTKWDRQTDAGSRGAVLFQMFVSQYLSTGPGGLAAKMRVKYDPKRPVETATGLADPAAAAAALEKVAAECRRLYGSLDIPWGDVYRFASGNADVPGNGGPGTSGVFRTIRFSERKGNRFYAAHGETFVCVIEFAQRDRQRARCALSYGNSSQPGSPHLEDQLPLVANKQLHPVVRDRNELDKAAELRERLPE